MGNSGKILLLGVPTVFAIFALGFLTLMSGQETAQLASSRTSIETSEPNLSTVTQTTQTTQEAQSTTTREESSEGTEVDPLDIDAEEDFEWIGETKQSVMNSLDRPSSVDGVDWWFTVGLFLWEGEGDVPVELPSAEMLAALIDPTQSDLPEADATEIAKMARGLFIAENSGEGVENYPDWFGEDYVDRDQVEFKELVVLGVSAMKSESSDDWSRALVVWSHAGDNYESSEYLFVSKNGTWVPTPCFMADWEDACANLIQLT